MRQILTPEKPYFFIDSENPHPDMTGPVAYVDGAGDPHFRSGTDIELSHWLGNVTPDKYKADTSTAICFNFLAHHLDCPYAYVINNHIDIDGLLSVFVLSYPTLSLLHKEILCEVARMGDFWIYGRGLPLTLYQELSTLYRRMEKNGNDQQDIATACFEQLINLLTTHKNIPCEVQKILEAQCVLIETGKIQRTELTDCITLYHLPKNVVGDNIDEFLAQAEFNEPISERLAFWPQVCNRYDSDKIQILAIESDRGTYYEFFYPGYTWADTKGLWRPAGMTLQGHTYAIQDAVLDKICDHAQSMEKNAGAWRIFDHIRFDNTLNARNFPSVGGFFNEDGKLSPSSISVNMFKDFFED